MALLSSMNVTGSAMVRVDETYNETKERAKRRLKQYEEAQRARAHFQIGSVVHLKPSTDQFERSQPAAADAFDKLPESCNLRTILSEDWLCFECHKCQQFAAQQQLSGLIASNQKSEEQSCLPEPYLIPAHVKNSREAFISKNASGKLKLVELYQYTGFNENESTALPNDVESLHILRRVINAQSRRYHESYRQELEQVFYSGLSQAILQDIFWWTFLNYWQPDADSQSKLLSRMAKNYINLQLLTGPMAHRERFLKDYPMLTSQAVFAAFCESFIDSCQQFDEQFREKIMRIVHEWLTGVRPAAGLSTRWNVTKLEPEEITSRKKILQNSEPRKSIVSELIQWPDESDSGTLSRLSARISSRQFRHLPPSVVTMINGDQASDRLRRKPAQGSTHFLSRHDSGGRLSVQTNSSADQSDTGEAGPSSSCALFNLNGHSPAMAHLLASNNLKSKAGLNILINHIEVENLIPLDSQNHQDVIRSSRRTIRHVVETYKKFYERTTLESLELSRKLREEQRVLKQKDDATLRNPREVHVLGELLASKHKTVKPSSQPTA